MEIRRRPETCPAKLRQGEVKRIPVRSLFYLAGYYVGCPVCGRPQCIPAGETTFTESGLDVGEEPILSMSEVTCDRCRSRFAIEANVIRIVHRGVT